MGSGDSAYGGAATGDRLPYHWNISTDVGVLRDRLEFLAADAGLPAPRVVDLLLAVNEAVSNVLEHGGGQGSVTIANDDHALTVEVLDHGGMLGAEHLPRNPPAPLQNRGYGLWIISQVCDELTIHREPGRSLMTMRMSLPGRA